MYKTNVKGSSAQWRMKIVYAKNDIKNNVTETIAQWKNMQNHKMYEKIQKRKRY